MNLYELTDYKIALRQALLEKKATVSKRFTFQAMARACRVQKTYLSRVLAGSGDLSSDQLYMACDYLGFTASERTYVSLIYEKGRTQLSKRRQELDLQIKSMREQQNRTDRHISVATMQPPLADLTEYYLDPLLQYIHMFLTIPRFSKDVALIAKDLKVSEERLVEAISTLQRLQIIEVDDEGRCHLKEQGMHLRADSPLFRPYRQLLRLKGLELMAQLPPDKSYNFSVVFSANEDVKKFIHQRFLNLLADLEGKVKSCQADRVYQMGFDLMELTGPSGEG